MCVCISSFQEKQDRIKRKEKELVSSYNIKKQKKPKRLFYFQEYFLKRNKKKKKIVLFKINVQS